MTSRIEQLEALRERIDHEIRAERSRLVRIAILRDQLRPVDRPEPSRAPANIVRRWLLDNGHEAPKFGRVNIEGRILYAEAGEPYGRGEEQVA